MHPLQNGSQVVSKPDATSQGVPGYFTEVGNPSWPGADWFNANIAEFQNVMLEAGIDFDPKKFDHLAKAIKKAYTFAESKMTQETADSRYVASNEGGLRRIPRGGTKSINARLKYEIGRFSVDVGQWHSHGTIIVEIYNKHHDAHGYKKYSIRWGYKHSVGRITLVEAFGDSGKEKVVIGEPVIVNGSIKYLPVYLEQQTYNSCTVILTTGFIPTSDLTPNNGYCHLPTPMPYEEIASFSSDEQVTIERSIDVLGDIKEKGKHVYGPDNSPVDDIWLELAAKICPVGVPLPWPADIAPNGFAIMKNNAFDPKFTETLKAYPNGILPDMRGLGIVGKNDNELVLAYEEGQVKNHGHPNSTVSSTNLGNKSTASAGAHTHTANGQNRFIGNARSDSIVDAVSRYSTSNDGNWYKMSNAGAHTHPVSIGSHAHNVVIALFGAAKNTIDNRKFNWIVRLA